MSWVQYTTGQASVCGVRLCGNQHAQRGSRCLLSHVVGSERPHTEATGSGPGVGAVQALLVYLFKGAKLLVVMVGLGRPPWSTQAKMTDVQTAGQGGDWIPCCRTFQGTGKSSSGHVARERELSPREVSQIANVNPKSNLVNYNDELC